MLSRDRLIFAVSTIDVYQGGGQTATMDSHPFRRPVLRLSPQSGSSMIEMSVIAAPLLLVGLGSIEIAQWFFTKQAVSLALLEAGRAGTTNHANPDAIKNAFESALTPLYARPSNDSAIQALNDALNRRSAQTDTAAWQIEVLSPSPQAFQDFSDPALNVKNGTGLATINNNYQFEQDQRKRALGWPNGQGAISGLTIFQANTLVLRLTYLHEPVLPGIKGLIRTLATNNGSYAQKAMATGGYLPLKQEIALVMQSHPANWPALPSGKVIGKEAAHEPAVALAKCVGIWCLKPLPATANTGPGVDTGSSATNLPGRPLDPGASNAATPSNVSGGEAVAPGDDVLAHDELAVAPDDPACGVTVCCVAG